MVTRFSCGIVTDLCSYLQKAGLVPHANNLINALCTNLRAQDIGIDSKLVAITAIGDIMMACEDSFGSLIADIVTVFEGAA
jgi:hypothetical protein